MRVEHGEGGTATLICTRCGAQLDARVLAAAGGGYQLDSSQVLSNEHRIQEQDAPGWR